MLRDISGEKIRRQYFNIPIYLLLSIFAAIISAWMTASVVDQTFGSEKWLGDALFLFAVMVALFLPLLTLSVLNRLCFGRVICVLNDKGLYYEDDGIHHISWNDIKTVAYEPDVPGKLGHRYFCCNTTYITIKPFKKKIEIELQQAPYYLLGKMKKYNSDAQYGFTKMGIVMILFYILGPALVSILTIMLN